MRAGRLQWFARLEETVTLLFFLLMSLAVLLQLVFRFLFNRPLLYPEEISRYCYVWITFIGLALATKTGEHIRVDLLVQLLSPAWRRRIERATAVLSAVALLFLAALGIRFLEFSRMSISSALEMPMNLVYVAFPLGCLLAVVRLLRGLCPGRPSPPA